MNRISIFAAVAALSLVSCQKEDITIPTEELIPRKDFVLTRSQEEFIQANNGFALDLFRRVSRAEKDKSLLISPLSITIDFGMVNNGAVGKTQQEIYETLGYRDGSVEGLNDFCQTMMEQSSAVDPSTTLEIANAAIINKMYPGLKDSFTKKVQAVYDAEIIYKDFSKEDIRNLVNDWCKKKTHGMIPELLTMPVQPSEYAHFLNAVYFKGIWSSKFKKADTKRETFTREDGTKKTVPMMQQEDKFNFGGIPNLCTAVSLPYGNQAYSMTFLLPAEGITLAELTEALDADVWDNLSMYGTKVHVKIPSFETEYSVGLREILQDMGIRQAFGVGGTPDFSAMTSSPVYISQVLHKARIKVDEEGSEAAAVTDIMMAYAAYPGATPPVREFHADRPFLYVISEVSSGAIYFIGRYTGE